MSRMLLGIAVLAAAGGGIAFGALVLDGDEASPEATEAPTVVTVDRRPPEVKQPALVAEGRGPLKLGAGANRVSATVSASFQPSEPVSRTVTIEGATYAWNGQTRTYEPADSFRRQALLLIDTDGNFGIFAGGVAESSPGRLWFATNSYVYRLISGPAAHVSASRIQAAPVSQGEGTLNASVGANARAVQLNSFQVGGQLAPKQILAGQMVVNVGQGPLGGTIDLYGGAYIEPGNSFPVNLYRATFSG